MDLKVLLALMLVMVCTIESKAVKNKKRKISAFEANQVLSNNFFVNAFINMLS